MPVRVAKNVRIASRIELEVVPLTVQDAMGTSLPLPPNVPNDDPHSPPFASKIIKYFEIYSACGCNSHTIFPDLNDFNNTNITLIFEPDENAPAMIRVMNAPIPIIDDVINEATEQVFVVELRLISRLVDLSIRPSSLCRIIDNDRKYDY